MFRKGHVPWGQVTRCNNNNNSNNNNNDNNNDNNK